MEDDGFLSEAEREAPISANAEAASSSAAILNAAELLKTKKRGSDQKSTKRLRTLPAASDDASAISAATAPIAQRSISAREQSTGLCMPIVQLWQQQPAEGTSEIGGTETYGTGVRLPHYSPVIPFRLLFLLNFLKCLGGL